VGRQGRSGVVELLEREDEVVAIAGVVAGAASGSGRILMIEGSPGIGKTRLLWEARRLAADAGFRTLGARCDELEDSIAFGVASQLLTAPLQRAKPGERAALLDGAAARTAPLLLGIEAGSQETLPPIGDPGQAMQGALTWLVDNLAVRSPVALLIDDAQWADRESLRWLNSLEKRLAEIPVLVALTLRTSDADAREEAIVALGDSASCTVLRPPPLSEAAARALLAHRLREDPSSSLSETAHHVTGGNPLMLDALALELLAQGAGAGAQAASVAESLVPESLIRSVLLRLRRLPPDAVPIAEALAILGEAPASAAIELAGLAPDAGEIGIESLQAAELIEGGAELRFSHPIIRSTIYEQIAPRRRYRRHVQAAALLRAQGEAPERIAPHLIASGDDDVPGGAEILFEAGRRVYALGAPEATVRYLLRALDLHPDPGTRAEILLQLGAAAIRALDGSAIEHLRAAVDAAAPGTQRRSALMELARAHMTVLDLESAASTFELAAAESEGDRELELSADAELASAQLNLHQAGAAVDRLTEHRGTLAGETPAERKLLAVCAFAAAQSNEPAADVIAMAAAALGEDAVLIDEQSCASVIVVEVMLGLVMAEGYAELEPALERAIRDARERGWPIGFAMASAVRSWMHLRRGNLGAAEADAQAAEDVRALHGATPLDLFVAAYLARILHERGEDAEALELIASRCPEPIPDAAVFQLCLMARGEIRLASGDREGGLADVLLTGERELRFGGLTPAALPWRSVAALALSEGDDSDRRRAIDLADEELALAKAMGAARAIGIATRARALIGPEDEAVAGLERSIALLREAGARLELARTLTDLGSLLRRRRQQRDARDPLREAAELAGACGASTLAQRARDELGATGVSRSPSDEDGVASLTPSELRAARMAAEGRSNREIAQDLFVTPRTIEIHLSRTYRKLDIRSRKELPEALSASSRSSAGSR
jgi:DNA-binding CsgD family transcriptional regulator